MEIQGQFTKSQERHRVGTTQRGKDQGLWASEAKEKPNGGHRIHREGEVVGRMRDFQGSGQLLEPLHLERLGSP